MRPGSFINNLPVASTLRNCCICLQILMDSGVLRLQFGGSFQQRNVCESPQRSLGIVLQIFEENWAIFIRHLIQTNFKASLVFPLDLNHSIFKKLITLFYCQSDGVHFPKCHTPQWQTSTSWQCVSADREHNFQLVTT